MTARADLREGLAPEAGTTGDSDEQLVRKLGAGDENALRVLHQRYAALVFTVAARFVDTTTAEDVVQDVFVTLFQKHQTFDPARGSFKNWVVQIARHRALNEVRGKKHRGEQGDAVLTTLPDESLEPDEMAWLEHRRAVIRRAVDALPSAQRQALSLAFFDELTHEQIASILRTPVGTTKTRIRLALRRLAPLLLAVLSAVFVVFVVRRRNERAARTEQALRMVTASDVVPLRLTAAPGRSPDIHGAYRARPGARVAVLTTSHLPALVAPERYVAWAHRKSGWTSLGTVVTEGDGRSVLVTETDPVSVPDELRVTVETTGDAHEPRGSIVLRWSSPEATPAGN